MKTLYLIPYLLFSFAESTNQSDWILLKAVDNLEVYTRSTVESKFKEVKIKGKIKCTMSEIVAVLEDIGAQKDWVMRTLDVDLLEKRNAGDFSYYIRTDMPFPVKDRELIVDHKRTEVSDGQIRIELLTSEYKLNPNEEYLPIPYYSSTYLLKELRDGWIDIQYQVMLDPGGILPAWIYNMAVTKGPISSFEDLYDIIHSGAYQITHVENLN